MSNLAPAADRAKPGDVEGTRFVREFSQPEGVKRLDLEREGFAQTPWALIRLGFTSKQLEVFFELDRMCRAEGRTWCIPGTRLFERAIGVNEGTARKALKALAAKGVIHTEHAIIDGVRREVIHCPWLFPDPWAGAVLEFGQGVGFDVDKGKTVRTGKPERRPTVPFPGRVPGGAKCAPEGAPRSAPKQDGIPEGEKSKARGGCFAAFALGGEPKAEPAPIPEAAPGPDPAKVAELVAALREPAPAGAIPAKIHRTARRLAYHELTQLGPDLVPADLAGPYLEEFGPPPEPEAPRARAVVAPPPPSAKDLIYRLANPTGPEAVAEALERLARDLEAPAKSLARKVDGAAAGAIPPAFLWEGYQQAMGPGARKRGAVFNAAVNRLMGVPR